MPSFGKPLRSSVFVALILVAGGLLFWQVTQLSSDELSSGALNSIDEESLASQRGGVDRVASRPHDPAHSDVLPHGQGWVLKGFADVAQLAENPRDLDKLIQKNPERWAELQSWKMQQGGRSQLGLAKQLCRRELGEFKEPCENRVAIVISRTAEVEGKVVHVRPAYNEDERSNLTEGCRRYGDCVGKKGWIGRNAPLPRETDKYYSFLAGDLVVPFTGEPSARLELLKQDIDQLRSDLAALNTQEPKDEPKISLLEDLLEYELAILEEMES